MLQAFLFSRALHCVAKHNTNTEVKSFIKKGLSYITNVAKNWFIAKILQIRVIRESKKTYKDLTTKESP